MAIRLPAEVPALKSKKPARKQAFLNLAPLTGIAFAFKWLISKLNLNCDAVKTTKMTTNRRRLRKSKKLRGIVDHFE
ncbi:TPA: hypothetical protein MDQ25_004719 [Klebsiella pneumoniae]|nr:hypothetical protein BCV49_18175 [Klebsiella pneumoniae]MBU4661161.1 hypothetical protein [Klebsiella pneumoniae]HBT3809647.1 hypothetical protein [Klebsiella pneumoniae]HBV1688937.1 hypothetical protein [Klebsiella pneumoniae]HBV1694387.1 hypothetical protein [Klebsiella pneumoniae]